MRRAILRSSLVAVLALAGGASSILAAGPRAIGPGGARTTTATTAATTSAPLVTSTAPTVLAVSGHGYGHGLGMSQWGAYGYAKHGFTYDAILAHYYSGTTLGSAKVASVRVLLLQAKRVQLSSAVAWTVHDATGATASLPTGALTLGPALKLAGVAKTLTPPLRFTSAQPIALAGAPYRGSLVVSTDGKRLQVVDVVGLEAYLKGVVPSEMPASWPTAALEAQAVAARSYALANVTHDRDFDLYSDTRSQVYGGVAAESPAASAAVAATKGQIVTYGGKVADTLFFSSSGGRTASAVEETGTAVPYLVSVPDPYDASSPDHDWGPVLFDAAAVAKKLKLPGALTAVQTVTGPSGRVERLTATAGTTPATVTGAQVRDDLGLRSTWFTPSLLQLLPVSKTITYGGALSLTGFARGATGVLLEAKTALVDWSPAGDLTPAADGTFSAVVKPQAATQYRLAWGSVRAGLVHVAVAARVAATATAAGVTGTERPVVAGAVVQLQQLSGTTWTTLASSTASPTGAIAVATPLTSGTYRVRCAPAHGIAPGLSPTLTVQ